MCRPCARFHKLKMRSRTARRRVLPEVPRQYAIEADATELKLAMSLDIDPSVVSCWRAAMNPCPCRQSLDRGPTVGIVASFVEQWERSDTRFIRRCRPELALIF